MRRLFEAWVGSVGVVLTVGILVLACGDETSETGAGGDTGTGGGNGGIGGATGPVGGAAGAGGSISTETPSRRTLTGDAIWTVTFDETAHAAGAEDCTYTRHYVAVEDRSSPWQCPLCETPFHADVTMTDGQDDCFAQISEYDPQPTEWVGWAGGAFYRGYLVGPTAQGTAEVAADTVTWANLATDQEASMGGLMSFTVAGTFQLGGDQGDPNNGWVETEPYAGECAWPNANPAPYAGDYTLAAGAAIPDGLFKDSCGQIVRLHDFQGAYLLIDMAAVDCPVCRSMAQDQEQFISDMATQGATVKVITLLCPALDDPFGETTANMLNGWESSFSLTQASPVLGDRAWALTMLLPHFPEELGYPSWILVDPELRVMEWGSGFTDFSDHEAAILADL